MNDLAKFEEYIKFLSEKLQKPSEFVYDILLRQVWFDGAWSLVGFLFGLFLTFGVGRFAYKRLKILAEEDPFNDGGIQWLCLFPVGVGVLFCGINLYWILQIVINPHWYMIEMVLDLAKGK